MQRTIRPERVLAAGFLILILTGSVLLALPAASADGRGIGLGRSLFTATSAVCVTGLIVVDTGTGFSLFGQIVLLLMIQTGGLGFMVFATLIMVALGRRITLRNRMLMRESMNTTTLSGLVRLTLWNGLVSMGIELAGAALLCVRFVPLFGWIRGSYYALWHAVSAFCNAGFDLFGRFGSLTAFYGDPLVLLTVALLIILGGLGFSVMLELAEKRFRWRSFSLHTHLTLAMTGLLLLAGTAAIAFLEWRNPDTLGRTDSGWYRLLNAFFQSATMRTAGFNSISLSGMTDASKLFCVLLMFIGASAASTGGGIKTTTAAAVFLAVRAVIRGDADVTIRGRRLGEALLRRAVAVMAVAVSVLLAAVMLLTIAEGGRVPFIDLLFEAASAAATVGVSSAGTPGLSRMSRVVLIPVMYLGRVGPLTLALALTNRQGGGGGKLRYPEESITIG